MRILTNISKTELNQLTNQPTAKAMIDKVKNEGIYIAEGDAQGAAEFVSKRNQEKSGVSLDISAEGLDALNKKKEIQVSETNEDDSKEEQIKKEIAKLEKELAEIRAKQKKSKDSDKALERKANAIVQQISALNMQLIQIEKNKSESGTV